MDNSKGAHQWGGRRSCVKTTKLTATVPSRRLNKQVSDSLSSPSQRSSPSPSPTLLSSSSSAASSTSFFVAAHHNQSTGSKCRVATASGTVTGEIGTVARMNHPKTKKMDKKWTCPKCHGDVRLPPPASVTGATTRDNEETTDVKDFNGKSNPEEECVREALDSATVMCALKCCPTPRYHVSS